MHMICVSICFIQQGHIKPIKIESIFHIIAIILSFIIHQIILGGGGGGGIYYGVHKNINQHNCFQPW